MLSVEHRIFAPKYENGVHTKSNRQGQLPSGYTSVKHIAFTTYCIFQCNAMWSTAIELF